MFIEPGTAVAVGEALWENRKKLLPLLKKLRFWLTHGTLHVPIFGPGGTGKTTLAKLLSGELIASAKYKESLVIEEKKLKGDLVCNLIAVPGQEHREYDWKKLYHELSVGRSAGIINVVSWGYHSFVEVSYEKTKYFKAGQTKEEFVVGYLQSMRKREEDIIRALSPRICDAKGRLWMITLVTKQDLWWDQRDIVQKHYTQGVYNECIEKIFEQRGRQNFAHEYLSASLVLSNLATDAGELLAATTSGYDEYIKQLHLQKLIEAVTDFALRFHD